MLANDPPPSWAAEKRCLAAIQRERPNENSFVNKLVSPHGGGLGEARQ